MSGKQNYRPDNGSSSHVLVLHRLFCVLSLLIGTFLKELGKSVKGLIVSVKVVGHREVDVVGSKLQIEVNYYATILH